MLTGPRAPDTRPVILFAVNVAWFFLSHRLPIARAARRAGYDVHVLGDIGSEAEIASIEEEGFTFHRAHLQRGGLNPLADICYLLRAFNVIRQVAPTLIHNVTVKPVLYGTLAARVRKVPGIVNAISGLGYSFTGESRRILARLLGHAYRWILGSERVRVIFQNEDDASRLLAMGAVKPQQIVMIRGSGVNLSVFPACPEEIADAPLVVLPARILRDKGVVEFVEAAKILQQRGIHARFALAGGVDPANPAALTKPQIEQLLTGTAVQWLGHVGNVPDLYRRAHVVCLPSYREGMPKALIEACGAGRPIVTTDVPGCRDVVDDGVNGLLVPARDAGALADALQRLITDPSLRMRLGREGRNRAEKEFDEEIIAEQTVDLYAQLVGRS